jgi:hypothetical protein
LKRRGYNDKVIKSGFSKASEINRNDLLEYKERKINKRVPLVLTYHPSLEKISGIVRHHWKEIEKSETLAKLFPEPPKKLSFLSLILFPTWIVVNEINFGSTKVIQ